MDGFDHYASADAGIKWTAADSVTVGSTYKRNGTNGALTGYGDSFYVTLSPSTAASGVMGMAIQKKASGSGPIIAVKNNDGTQFYLAYESDNTIGLYSGGNAFRTNSTVALTVDQWYYFEVKWTIADSGATVQVRLNGGSDDVLTYTGDWVWLGGCGGSMARVGLGETDGGGSEGRDEV